MTLDTHDLEFLVKVMEHMPDTHFFHILQHFYGNDLKIELQEDKIAILGKTKSLPQYKSGLPGFMFDIYIKSDITFKEQNPGAVGVITFNEKNNLLRYNGYFPRTEDSGELTHQLTDMSQRGPTEFEGYKAFVVTQDLAEQLFKTGKQDFAFNIWPLNELEQQLNELGIMDQYYNICSTIKGFEEGFPAIMQSILHDDDGEGLLTMFFANPGQFYRQFFAKEAASGTINLEDQTRMEILTYFLVSQERGRAAIDIVSRNNGLMGYLPFIYQGITGAANLPSEPRLNPLVQIALGMISEHDLVSFYLQNRGPQDIPRSRKIIKEIKSGQMYHLRKSSELENWPEELKSADNILERIDEEFNQYLGRERQYVIATQIHGRDNFYTILQQLVVKSGYPATNVISGKLSPAELLAKIDSNGGLQFGPDYKYTVAKQGDSYVLYQKVNVFDNNLLDIAQPILEDTNTDAEHYRTIYDDAEKENIAYDDLSTIIDAVMVLGDFEGKGAQLAFEHTDTGLRALAMPGGSFQERYNSLLDPRDVVSQEDPQIYLVSGEVMVCNDPDWIPYVTELLMAIRNSPIAHANSLITQGKDWVTAKKLEVVARDSQEHLAYLAGADEFETLRSRINGVALKAAYLSLGDENRKQVVQAVYDIVDFLTNTQFTDDVFISRDQAAENNPAELRRAAIERISLSFSTLPNESERMYNDLLALVIEKNGYNPNTEIADRRSLQKSLGVGWIMGTDRLWHSSNINIKEETPPEYRNREIYDLMNGFEPGKVVVLGSPIQLCKSHILAEVARQYQGPVIWINMENLNKEDDFMQIIAQAFRKNDRPYMANIMDRYNLPAQDLRQVLFESAQGLNMPIIIDNATSMSKEGWPGLVVPTLCQASEGVLMGSRIIPKIPGIISLFLQELPYEALAKFKGWKVDQDWLRYDYDWMMKPKTFEDIYKLTGGIPHILVAQAYGEENTLDSQTINFAYQDMKNHLEAVLSEQDKEFLGIIAATGIKGISLNDLKARLGVPILSDYIERATKHFLILENPETHNLFMPYTLTRTYFNGIPGNNPPGLLSSLTRLAPAIVAISGLIAGGIHNIVNQSEPLNGYA